MIKNIWHRRKLRNAVAADIPKHNLSGVRQARLLEAHDADSLRIAIVENGKVVNVMTRLVGIDAPEVNSKDPNVKRKGILARDFVAAHFLPRKFKVGDMTPEGQLKKAFAETPVQLVAHCYGFDKYGRLLVMIYKRHSKECLNELLVKAGHAVPYGGRK